MTVKEAVKILNQIGKPLSKNKKRWVLDEKLLEAVEIIRDANNKKLPIDKL